MQNLIMTILATALAAITTITGLTIGEDIYANASNAIETTVTLQDVALAVAEYQADHLGQTPTLATLINAGYLDAIDPAGVCAMLQDQKNDTVSRRAAQIAQTLGCSGA